MLYISTTTPIRNTNDHLKDFNVGTLDQNMSGPLQYVLLVPPPGSSLFEGAPGTNQWQRMSNIFSKLGYTVLGMIPPGKKGYFGNVTFDKNRSTFDFENNNDCGKFRFREYAQNIFDVLHRYETSGNQQKQKIPIVTSSLGQIPVILALGDELQEIRDVNTQRKVVIGAPIMSLTDVLQKNRESTNSGVLSDLDIIKYYAQRNTLYLDENAIEEELQDPHICGSLLYNLRGSVDLGIYGNKNDLYLPADYSEPLIKVPKYTFTQHVPGDPFFHEFAQKSADEALTLVARFLETGTFGEKKGYIR